LQFIKNIQQPQAICKVSLLSGYIVSGRYCILHTVVFAQTVCPAQQPLDHSEPYSTENTVTTITAAAATTIMIKITETKNNKQHKQIKTCTS